MTTRGKVILLPPNRVWRSYTGGRTLDQMAGVAAPADGHFPEDWIASTTRAVNIGREEITEGPSRVNVGGKSHDLAALLAGDPEYFLGAAHAARHGPEPHLLVKFLDPSIRLHLQVHPSADFARRRLQERLPARRRPITSSRSAKRSATRRSIWDSMNPRRATVCAR
jgi:mannose-6-phosphate isomerase